MFAHLNVHTDHSFLDGTCQVERLVARAKALGYASVAVTDSGNLLAAVPFYLAAKAAGIKPVLGCELELVDGSRLDPANKASLGRITIWAQNAGGYQNLMRLVSDANLKGKSSEGTPRVDLASLREFHEGLIASTGDQDGFFSAALLKGDTNAAVAHAQKLVAALGKEGLVVEASNFGDDRSAKLLPKLVAISRRLELPIVATNDVHYLTREEFGLHDTLTCIATGQKKNTPFRQRAAHAESFLKSPAEMSSLFRFVPEAIRGAEMLVDRCNVEMTFGQTLYPAFPLNSGEESAATLLQKLTHAGLAARFPKGVPAGHLARLNYELTVIEKTGFSDYYLIVGDIVQNAKNAGIPVGPGRGSGAGSLAAFAMGITNLDPLQHGLLFERFLNPERISPPDFDIDFCEHRRGEVFEYVRQKYGAERTAQISAVGTFGARGVIRELGRAYGLDQTEIDQVANTMPDDPNTSVTLRDAYEKVPEFAKEIGKSDTWRAIYAEGQLLEGLARNQTRHAAGILIAPGKLTDVAPLMEQKGEIAVQLDKDSVEKLGLLKLDLLGVSTISVIHEASGSVARTKKDFALESIPFDDPKTFSLLREKRTAGVFQLGSPGMTAACATVGVDNFNDLMAVIALYRPGPKTEIDQYAAGKRNPKAIKAPHPLLADTTRETNGILIYQEQVMEAAKKISGFSLGEADVLRKAMGKKDPVLMEQQRDKFVAGAAQNKIEGREAAEVFATIEKFAGYGFNKSHSAGYAILAYQTAYLKANHPAHFMAAVLTSKAGKPMEKAKLLAECRAMNLRVLPPDINASNAAFTVGQSKGNEALLFGLANIKGVGEAAAQKIAEERTARGPFKGVQDLMGRVDARVVNQKTVETLIMAGAFDGVSPDRQRLLARFQQAHKITEPLAGTPAAWEKELLGQYVTNHPLDRYGPLPAALATHTASSLASAKHRETAAVVGAVASIERRKSRKDDRPWATAVIETADGPVRATMFSEAYAKTGFTLQEGQVVFLRGQVEQDPQFGTRFQVGSALDMAQATPSLIRHASVNVQAGKEGDAYIERFKKFAASSPGVTRIDLIQAGKPAESVAVKFKLKAFEQMLSAAGLSDFRVSTSAPGRAPAAIPKPADIEQELATAEAATTSRAEEKPHISR